MIRRPESIYFVCLASALVLGACASTSNQDNGRTTTSRSTASPATITAAFELAGDAQNDEERGRTDQAIAKYRAALQRYREFPAAWNNLGVLLMEEGRFLEAGECFAAAADLAPLDPRPAYNLGLTWDRAGYLEEALRHYNRALDRDPRYLPALRGSIRTQRYLAQGDLHTLERLRSALLLEQDPEWRKWFDLQVVRLNNELRQTGVGVR